MSVIIESVTQTVAVISAIGHAPNASKIIEMAREIFFVVFIVIPSFGGRFYE